MANEINFGNKTIKNANLDPATVSGVVSGSANQVVYKNSSNVASGSDDLIFDGSYLTTNIKGYSLKTNMLGNISGSVSINISNGNYVTGTVVGAVTSLIFTGQSSSNTSGFILKLTNGGAYSFAWPTSVKWPSGTAPTLTSSGIDILTFITDDNGVTWRGVLSMADSK